MTNEEKKAIERLKSFADSISCGAYSLIETQQKEIEELKETLKCTQNSWYKDTKIIDKIQSLLKEE